MVLIEELNGVQDLKTRVSKEWYFNDKRLSATLTTLGLRKASPPLPEITVTVTVLAPLTKVPAGTLHS